MQFTWRLNSRLLRNRLFNPARRGGGTLRFLSGDLFDPDLWKGPYDVVIERRTVQLHQGQEQDLILDRLSERLRPNCIFVSDFHMGWWGPGDPEGHMLESWLRGRGFLIFRERLDTSDKPTKNSRRIALLSEITGCPLVLNSGITGLWISVNRPSLRCVRIRGKEGYLAIT